MAAVAGRRTPSDAGGGIPLASGGVRVPCDADDPSAVFVANGRNQLYLRTFQGSTPCATNKGTCEQTLALQVTSESSDEMALCTHATVLRPAFDEGSFDQPITQQPAPTAAPRPVPGLRTTVPSRPSSASAPRRPGSRRGPRRGEGVVLD